MKIKEQVEGENLTLIMQGDFDETGALKAEVAFDEAISKDVKNILLDMSHVRYISSLGIRVLILAHKKAIKRGKRVLLFKMSDKVREIIHTVGILRLLSPEGVDVNAV
jgi:anti-anti-sigma factor